MGILNITPDSFSDGGRHLDPEVALDRGLEMLEEGADVLDLGAESTRPGGGVYGEGASEVSWQMERSRLLPVLRRLRSETDAPISVDTRKARVAEEALDEGADLVNDISSLADPPMTPLLAARDVPVVLMHSRGELSRMQRGISFTHVVDEVRRELERAVDEAISGGVRREQIIVDPGIGFGKTRKQNLALLAHLDVLTRIKRPLLIGASRKSFLGEITGASTMDRLPGSLATAAWAACRGAHLLRVHDVVETRRFLEVWASLEEAKAAL